MLLPTPSSPRSAFRARLLPGLSLHVGDTLGGRYHLVSLVRADRAVVVLHGESPGMPHAVDVHVLVGDAVSDSIRMRFVAEARKTASLRSPHVARVLHVGVTADGHPFIVREHTPELTLAGLLEERHSLTTEHAVCLALDVCDALGEAHAHGITHGELGTHCVHLDWTPGGPTNTKVVGLATARVLSALPLDASTAFAPVVRAPELLARRDAPADERADVWGLGVLLYTMLAGAPPFVAETPSAISVSVAAEEQASLAGVPDALAELVDACLAKDPSLRPASIAEVADRLLPFASRPAEALACIATPPSLPPRWAVGETGEYEEQELARLRALLQRAPETDVSIDVEIGPSVRDVSEAAGVTADGGETRAASPPLAAALAPQTAKRSWGLTFALAAAACLAGIVIGVGATRGATVATVRSAPAAPARLTPPPEVAPPAAPEVAAPAPSPAAPEVAAPAPSPAAPEVAAPAPSPAAPTVEVASKPALRSPPSAARAPRPPAVAPAARASSDLVRSASAPTQPEPKANDDDLRRFLDDRR